MADNRSPQPKAPRVAIVHDWLNGMRGGERVLEHFLALYPQADILTLLHEPGKTSALIDSRVRQTSSLANLPGGRSHYRWYLPLFPYFIRQLKLDQYELVISLSHAAAKNINKPKGVTHICYCFTPMRYIWDQSERYFGKLRYLLWPLILLLRVWDRKQAGNVDHFVAISKFVAARIRLFYRRPSTVIYPPVNEQWYQRQAEQLTDRNERPQDFYLYVGALVTYKNVDAIISAFNLSQKNLVIVGGGPEADRLKGLAEKNITFAGRVSDGDLLSYYQQAKALVFAAKEDFGLIPVEAMAAGGLPVIAPRIAALRETLDNAPYWLTPENGKQYTGVFYRYCPETLAAEINQGIEYFEAHPGLCSARACRSQAERFNTAQFENMWYQFLNEQGLARFKYPSVEC